MTIPDFQTVMRPLLAELTDGTARRVRDLVSAMSDHYGLDDEERAALLPSGAQRVIDNRVNWSLSHLFQAGLLARPVRGQVQLTDAGRDVLTAHPQRVDMAVLRQFESYLDFRARSSKAAGSPVAAEQAAPSSEPASPQDLLAQAVAENRAAIEGELIARAMALTPSDFERLVIRLLERMGYGRSGGVEHSGKSGDGGIDGIISQDPLGLDRIYVQAKRYAADQSIQRPAV